MNDKNNSNWDSLMGRLSTEPSIEDYLRQVDPTNFEFYAGNGHRIGKDISL